MSANLLLIDGKIDPSLIPASVVPTNPIFESLTIIPPTGSGFGTIVITNRSGDEATDGVLISKGVNNGDFRISQELGSGSYEAILMSTINGLNLDTTTLRGPTVLLGNESSTTPLVKIVGENGGQVVSGQVYDTVYNPVSRDFANVFSAGFITLNGSLPVSQNFTPARTGLHSLNICVQYNGLTTIGNDNIEYAFSSLSEGNTTCGVIKPADLPAYNASRNGIYNFSLMGYFTGGNSYTFTITAYGTGWNLDVQPSYAPIC